LGDKEKEKFPQIIQQKAFDRHSVKAFMMPINELPGPTPLRRAAPTFFGSKDCPIPFEAADLKVPERKPIKIIGCLMSLYNRHQGDGESQRNWTTENNRCSPSFVHGWY
jgi:hypothetical protein